MSRTCTATATATATDTRKKEYNSRWDFPNEQYVEDVSIAWLYSPHTIMALIGTVCMLTWFGIRFPSGTFVSVYTQ